QTRAPPLGCAQDEGGGSGKAEQGYSGQPSLYAKMLPRLLHDPNIWSDDIALTVVFTDRGMVEAISHLPVVIDRIKNSENAMRILSTVPTAYSILMNSSTSFVEPFKNSTVQIKHRPSVGNLTDANAYYYAPFPARTNGSRNEGGLLGPASRRGLLKRFYRPGWYRWSTNTDDHRGRKRGAENAELGTGKEPESEKWLAHKSTRKYDSAVTVADKLGPKNTFKGAEDQRSGASWIDEIVTRTEGYPSL
ncbi:hypothetical protein FOZ62_010787, partial [Perkinsus olseni]